MSMSWLNVKVLLTVVFDCNGVVHHELLPQDRTVNKEFYLEIMRRLREAIRQKRTELWKTQSWILHHDNAPADTFMLVREFLAKNKTVIMIQPPYTPGFVTADFFLFPKLGIIWWCLKSGPFGLTIMSQNFGSRRSLVGRVLAY